MAWNKFISNINGCSGCPNKNKHLHLFFDTEWKESNVAELDFPLFFRFHGNSPWGSNFNSYGFLKDRERFRYFCDTIFQARQWYKLTSDLHFLVKSVFLCLPRSQGNSEYILYPYWDRCRYNCTIRSSGVFATQTRHRWPAEKLTIKQEINIIFFFLLPACTFMC